MMLILMMNNITFGDDDYDIDGDVNYNKYIDKDSGFCTVENNTKMHSDE